MIKQLVILANKLDELGHVRAADEIDLFIKLSQLNVNKHDLEAAIEFYNNINLTDINLENLTLKDIIYMAPEKFLADTDTSDKGWLKEFPKGQWAELMMTKHGRDFSKIIHMYLANQMDPAIQINGEFADGIARSIFFNAVGEDMPVANFIAKE